MASGVFGHLWQGTMARRLFLIPALTLAIQPSVSSRPAMAATLAQAVVAEPNAAAGSSRQPTGSRGVSSRKPNVPVVPTGAEVGDKPNLPRGDPGNGRDLDAKDQGPNRPSDPQ